MKKYAAYFITTVILGAIFACSYEADQNSIGPEKTVWEYCTRVIALDQSSLDYLCADLKSEGEKAIREVRQTYRQKFNDTDLEFYFDGVKTELEEMDQDTAMVKVWGTYKIIVDGKTTHPYVENVLDQVYFLTKKNGRWVICK